MKNRCRKTFYYDRKTDHTYIRFVIIQNLPEFRTIQIQWARMLQNLTRAPFKLRGKTRGEISQFEQAITKFSMKFHNLTSANYALWEKLVTSRNIE